jgi:hypothetical protein
MLIRENYENHQDLTINLKNLSKFKDSARTNSDLVSGGDMSFPMSAKKNDDLDSFQAGGSKPKSLTLSEYQGSFEDANPHKLNSKIYSLSKLIKNHDVVNYSYSLSRDMTLARNFTEGYLSLMKNFENMIEKISDRMPVDSLHKMSDMTSKLAISINGFDTLREEEFKTKLKLRLKPLSSQKSSQKNSQRLRDQLQAIAEVDDEKLEQQEEEKGIRKISARLREKMNKNYHSESSSVNKMDKLKKLLKEEYET